MTETTLICIVLSVIILIRAFTFVHYTQHTTPPEIVISNEQLAALNKAIDSLPHPLQQKYDKLEYVSLEEYMQAYRKGYDNEPSRKRGSRKRRKT